MKNKHKYVVSNPVTTLDEWLLTLFDVFMYYLQYTYISYGFYFSL